MINRLSIMILLLALAVTGCTLSSAGLEWAATIDPVPTLSALNTPTVQPTQSPSEQDGNTPDEVAQATEAANHEQNFLPGCTIQHPDWPIYIVKPGDTLAGIATKVDSTVDVLAQVNCLVNANRIYVGQVLHVPLTYVPPEPVEPPPNIPLVDMGPPPAQTCVVVPNGEQAHIWGDVTGQTIAILVGTVRFVRHADNAYIVELPHNGVQGWVSALEAHLIGSTCPEQPDGGSGANPNVPPDLPVIRNGDTPPGNLCSVIKDPAPGTRYIYGGASNAHAPIAIMGDYLLFLAEMGSGYEVVLPGWDMTGWIPAKGVSLFGGNCPIHGQQG